jgi:hypothetical protein
MRRLLIVVGGFSFIALLVADFVMGVCAVGWMALVATRFPLIGERHRHDDWDKLNPFTEMFRSVKEQEAECHFVRESLFLLSRLEYQPSLHRVRPFPNWRNRILRTQ